ncbi:MAG: spore coat protein CotH [Candidatus Neomarinimicrobiota bacterium]|nr:MAG: spore coat protein CotH [Candidatus Neomarinimicrobiota bacterium]
MYFAGNSQRILRAVQVFVLVLATRSPAVTPVEFTSSNLPIVVIDTYGQEIPDTVRIAAHMGIIDNGPGSRNHLTDPFNGYDGRIAIELRGSSSLWYPKKQYRFETQDSFGDNLNVPLLGLPPENDWVFYGPYVDQSLIRNVLAYQLSRAIGRYASRTRYCELVINGDYRGLYVLLETVKRDAHRVDIAALGEADTTGTALTGGYILKIDRFAGESLGYWESDHQVIYQYHYPKPDRILPAQTAYIQSFMEQFETAMSGSNPGDSATGYPVYIDVDSFVDHFLLNELAKNVDAYRLSAFLYKKRDDHGGKLYAGPIWDFNLSFGKAWFPDDEWVYDQWQVNYNDTHPADPYQVPFWWIVLSQEPDFRQRVEARWQELRTSTFRLDSLLDRIDVLVAETAEARVRNFQRWPNPDYPHTYEEEILQLKGWLAHRVLWIDGHLQRLSLGPVPGDKDPNPPLTLGPNVPNPFNLCTTIPYGLAIRSPVRITVLNLRGETIRTLLNGIQPPGVHVVRWDGKTRQGIPAASGDYIIRIESREAAVRRIMTLLK